MVTTTNKKRSHRTPEQMIADLEADIERVKARAAAKAAKTSDEGKLFLAAVKATDKALLVAQDEGDAEMTRSLESARAALGEQLVRMGVRAPAIRGPRKRKAKGAA